MSLETRIARVEQEAAAVLAPGRILLWVTGADRTAEQQVADRAEAMRVQGLTEGELVAGPGAIREICVEIVKPRG